jgi:spore germination protein KC
LDLIDEAAIVKRKLKEAEGGEEGGGEENTSGTEKKQLRLNGTGLFHKDKLVGYMTDEETRGMLWVLGEVRGGAVVIPCPDQEKGNVVFGIKATKSQFTPSFDRKKLKLHIEIEEEGTISEVNCPKLDTSKPETIKKLEKLKSKDIEDRILQSIHKAQKLKSDIFGFGDEFHREDPKKWKEYEKDWGQHFSEVEVTVHVTCKIRRVGMISKPLKIEQ